MQCLIDFLSYENQMSLINLVQTRDETYQQELNSYKQLFLTMLNNITMGELAKNVEDRNQSLECIDYCPKGGECAYSSICYCIYKTIMTKIERNEINSFFNTIIYCYQCRINTDASTAIKILELLLDEYGIIPPFNIHKKEKNESEHQTQINLQELKIHNLDKRVLFRGRISVKEDQYFGKMDIFHVPYTQRYNLKNERFSLTGQPALYLGNSIPDLLEEMDININDRDMMKRVRISSYECISLKGDIYDLRCNYYDALNRQEHKLFTKELFLEI